jgi:hypothetical protein
VSHYTPIFLSILFFVFALTMAGDDKRDDQLQATKTKLDTIVSHLDAMKPQITGLQKEVNAGDLHGHARCASIRGGNDSFSTLPFTIPPYNTKYDPATYIDSELEVGQIFSCHDIPAISQVQTAISAFTDLALFWWHHEYKQKHPTTWAELKAAMRRRFVPSYYARNAEREVQGHRSKIYSNSFAGSGSTPSSASVSLAPSTSTPTPHERAESTAIQHHDAHHKQEDKDDMNENEELTSSCATSEPSDAQVAYGLGFGCSIYGWKQRFSNGTGLMPKFALSQRESSKQVDVQNLPRCCVANLMGLRPKLGAPHPRTPQP